MTDHPSDKHSPEPPVPEPSRSPTDQPIDPNLSSSTDSVGQNDEPSGHVTVYQRQTLQFTGPLPPPEVLHGFKEIDSTFPERIVVMAERQSEHRQSMERTSLDAQIQRSHSDVVTQRIGQSLRVFDSVRLPGRSGFRRLHRTSDIGRRARKYDGRFTGRDLRDRKRVTPPVNKQRIQRWVGALLIASGHTP